MGDVNYFGERNHYVFITYKDVIKLTYPVMLKEIVEEYYDDLKEYLNLDKIKNYDVYNMERICVERTNVNPLKYIKKDECPDELCDTLLKAFNEEFIKMYTKSRFSDFGAKLYSIIPQERIKEVYIYIEEPAEQVIIDCDTHFGEYKNKIKYLTGDFIKAIYAVPHKPTCYILNDIAYVHELIKHDLIAYTEIMIAELGCNYELDENLNMQLKGVTEQTLKEKVFKLAVIPLINLKREHFTQIDMDEFK